MKIKISNSFAVLVIMLVAFAFGLSFWLGSKFGDAEIINPQTHIKRFNEIKNLNDKRNQMANPASIYCIERKGDLEIRVAEDGNQVTYCVFDNQKECEVWAFFRKECDK